MIRSEAIVVLNNLRNYYSNRQGGEENAQALDFAIRSLLTDEAYQLEYERTTKNDLGVDLISRADVKRAIEDVLQSDNCDYDLRDFLDDLADIPSVTPQEPIKPMVEIDLYSVIKQKYIEREVLDKIRAEIMDCLKALDGIEKSGFNIYLPNELSGRRLTFHQCLEIIDKYKAETEEA